ncbi:MAG: MoxR family ATPase [Methanobacteriota archaeon]|nr:MAG: MoxR family ATPase [Euryarchaeota archaeon]
MNETPTIQSAEIEVCREKVNALLTNIQKIIRGKEDEIKKVLTALIGGGHILLEDLPGQGKTFMAKALAYSIEGHHTTGKNSGDSHVVFKRIQFTPDLLPMDLIGTFIFDDRNKDFIFKPGPLFANIVLADEINRASPKVQSALLECMAENQITVGEQTYPLDEFFFVIATQNPIEFEGTYPLPAAQLDRFFMKISFGYVSEEKELEIYQDYLQINKIPETIHPVIKYEDVLLLRSMAEKVHVHPEILRSVNNIVRTTRNDPHIRMGASTRGGIIFLRCLRAFALLNGRSYVIEDDIKHLAFDVLNHRMIYKSQEEGEAALKNIVSHELERLAGLRIGE